MQFWIKREFKFWENDKLIAHYLADPSVSYRLRADNDRLKALLIGGPLPGQHPVYIEEAGQPLIEIKPGETCPGWDAEGRTSFMPPEGAATGGSLEGTATVGGN